MNGQLIQDIKPMEKQLSLDVATDRVLKEGDTRTIIKGLYDRGVSMREIWAVFYELDEAGDGRLDVADAQLVYPTSVIKVDF